MSLATDYADAVFPDQTVILGVRLQPYCVGHALLLQKIRSPFVGCGEQGARGGIEDWIGVGDLVAALLVCSLPWDKAAKSLDSRITRWRLRRWAKQLRKPKAAPAVVAAETQLKLYIDEAWRAPETWDKTKGSSRAVGAPALTTIKVVLRTVLHCTESEAFSTPLKKALFDQAAWVEMQGDIEIVGEEDKEALEELERRNRLN